MLFEYVKLFQWTKFTCVIQVFTNSNYMFTSIIPCGEYTDHMQQTSKYFTGNIQTYSFMLFL